MTPEFVAAGTLREGRVLHGTFHGIPAILKRLRIESAWHDPRSAFFGGHGLVPPFVPSVLHEAAAWSRLGGDELLASGVDDAGAWIALRRQPGVPVERGSADGRALLVAGATFLARLHARDVLHRDLHPGNVLYEGEQFHFVDLDLARVSGLGVPGRVGKRQFRAPETLVGSEDARADLYSLGRMVTWCARAVPPKLQPLLRSLVEPDRGARPTSANAVLVALGAESHDPANLSPPAPALAAWQCTRWVDLVDAADPWQVIRLARAEDLDRNGLAAVAGRLLARAATTDTWRALGALCGDLWQRTGDRVYQLQQHEAVARSESGAFVAVVVPPSLHGWRPDDPAAWVLGVRSLLRAGDAAVVARALGELGASFGARPFVLASHEALQAGHAATAAAFATFGISVFPDDAPLRVLHASALLLAEDARGAERELDTLRQTHPGDGHGWLLRALLEHSGGSDPSRSVATAAALQTATVETLRAVTAQIVGR